MSDPTLPESTEDSGLKRFHSGGWCKGCGREWTGLSECHCASCHCHFTSDSAFDRHLANPNALENCHDPAHVLDKKKRRVFERVERKGRPAWKLRSFTPHYRSASTPPSFSDSTNTVARAGQTPPNQSEADVEAQNLEELKNEIRRAAQ